MSEEIETGVSHIAYFRTDGGSSKLYTQEYVDDLQKEIERLNNIINETKKILLLNLDTTTTIFNALNKLSEVDKQ